MNNAKQTNKTSCQDACVGVPVKIMKAHLFRALVEEFNKGGEIIFSRGECCAREEFYSHDIGLSAGDFLDEWLLDTATSCQLERVYDILLAFDDIESAEFQFSIEFQDELNEALGEELERIARDTCPL